MYRRLILLLCGLLCFEGLLAQRTIAGKVTGCEGKPLQGATIRIKGTDSGTTADENGFYRIELSEELDMRKRALMFAYSGTKTKTVKINDKDTIHVKLEEINDEDVVMIHKPVIYLYPEKQTDISLQVNFKGQLHFTYPPYKNGWQVSAQSDGKLTDKRDGSEHHYLFWDGKMNFSDADRIYDRGFIVHKDSLVSFFRQYLPQMGLKPHEYNDFIVFWTPMMQKNEWNFIHFRTAAAYDIISTNLVNPDPDTEIRIFMEYIQVVEPFDIPAQEFAAPERKGFTLVEWGGAALEKVYFKRSYTRFEPLGKEVKLKKDKIRSCMGIMKPFNPEQL